MRFRLSTKPTWPELRARLAETLAGRFPGTAFDLAGESDPPAVTWHEGPAERSVVDAAGDITGWRFESGFAGPEPGTPAAMAVVRLDRSFSERAVAVAVVRYRASHPRPYRGDQPGARIDLWELLDEDLPHARRYPIVEAIAAMLVELPDPPPGDDPPGGTDPADRLSTRLEAAGYDRLWSKAWAAAEL